MSYVDLSGFRTVLEYLYFCYPSVTVQNQVLEISFKKFMMFHLAILDHKSRLYYFAFIH